jgi:nitrate/nitrite transporter NarK
MTKENLGALAVVVGIVGAGFGVGGVENSVQFQDLVVSIGVSVTSLMLMYLGTLLIKDEI